MWGGGRGKQLVYSFNISCTVLCRSRQSLLLCSRRIRWHTCRRCIGSTADAKKVPSPWILLLRWCNCCILRTLFVVEYWWPPYHISQKKVELEQLKKGKITKHNSPGLSLHFGSKRNTNFGPDWERILAGGHRDSDHMWSTGDGSYQKYKEREVRFIYSKHRKRGMLCLTFCLAPQPSLLWSDYHLNRL